MALRTVTVCSTSSEPAALANMQRLSLVDIHPDSSFNYKYIEGKIFEKFPLYSTGKKKRMKMVLGEEEATKDVPSPSRIIVFLTGRFAEEFIQFSVGDTVIISEALIETSSSFSKDSIHPCHILVEQTRSRPSVWVIPTKKQSKTTTDAARRTRQNPSTASSRPASTIVPTTSTRTSNLDQGTGPSSSAVAPSVPSTSRVSTNPGVPRGSTTASGHHMDAWTVPAASSSTTKVIPTQKQSKTTTNADRRTRQNPSTASSRPASTIVPTTSTRTSNLDQEAGPSSSAVAPSVPSTSRVSTNPGVPRGSTTAPGHHMDAWTVPAASSSTTKRSYTYTPLKDLKEASQVNIFGTVKFFKPSYKTKGPDYCMTVTLIDPTLDPKQRGLRCQLFQDDIKALPQVHTIGDIVRFHRLKITMYNGAMQGQKGNGFHCLVFDGLVDSPLEPRSSSPNFTLTDDDARRVKELRLWSSRQMQLALENHDCTLAKMYAGQYLDLTCQVVSVATLPAEKCVVVRVWDGTRYRGPVRVMDTNAAINTQCKPELVTKSEGLAFDVSLYDNHMETGTQLKPGQFIKFCNLHVAKLRQVERQDEGVDMVELVIHHGTSYGRGVITLMEWDQAVKDMIKRMEVVEENAPSNSRETILNPAQAAPVTVPVDGAGMDTPSANGSMAGTPSRCMQKSASVINNNFHQKTDHIRDVITSEVPNKFRIRAKVIDYLPQDITDFIHLYCPKCRFRCRVPSVSKSTPSEMASTSNKVIPTSRQTSPTKETTERREYNLRKAASKNVEGEKSVGTNQGVITRSAARRSIKDSLQRSPRVESLTYGHRNKTGTSGPSSAKEGSPGRRGTLRKRPASLISGEEGVRSPNRRKNRTGTSKMASRTGDGSAALEKEGGRRIRDAVRRDGKSEERIALSQEAGKRVITRDDYGHNIMVEMQSSEEDDVEEEGGTRRKGKMRVEIDDLSVQETLLMVRRGMQLVNHTDIPTSHGQMVKLGANHQSPADKIFYLCPSCSSSDDCHQALPDKSPLLHYAYCLKLLLNDGTGSIEVIVDKQHGQNFFQAIPATNLRTVLDTKFKLEEAMAKLCPFKTGKGFDTWSRSEITPVTDLSSHPWLECCIMSYRVDLGGTEVIKYQMFDTTLALDVE